MQFVITLQPTEKERFNLLCDKCGKVLLESITKTQACYSIPCLEDHYEQSHPGER